MPQDEITYIVRAIALQEVEALEEEDREVVGDHRIHLPRQALEWSDGEQATMVLDLFHTCVPVGVLEDFEFSVLTPDGREIHEED